MTGPETSRDASVLRDFTVLGLETSCDETAASVVRGHAPGPGDILSNVVLSQLEDHAPYGGVVPEIAARAHVEALDRLVEEALAQAKLELKDLDAIAATTPVNRLSSPEEIAAFFEFVAGPDTGYLTGENIVIDGGLKAVNAHTFAPVRPS